MVKKNMKLFNVRDMADELNIHYMKVFYACRLGVVKPCVISESGTSKLYDEGAVEALRAYFLAEKNRREANSDKRRLAELGRKVKAYMATNYGGKK